VEDHCYTVWRIQEWIAKDGYAIWIEDDYCSPPLATEKEAVLDRYFNDITTDRVECEEEGWNKINDKPMLWKKITIQ
jgi:hypothetical protein